LRIHIDLTDTRDPRAAAKVFDFPDGTVSLGRSLQNQIVIDGETISRVQTVLSLTGGRWQVAHQGSVATTELNGSPLERGVPAPLSSGDVVRVAHWELRVTIEGMHPAARETMMGGAADPMRATVMPGAIPFADPEMTIQAGAAIDDRTQVHRAPPAASSRRWSAAATAARSGSSNCARSAARTRSGAPPAPT
jgi:predicted component of type VI protein secretion system